MLFGIGLTLIALIVIVVIAAAVNPSSDPSAAHVAKLADTTSCKHTTYTIKAVPEIGDDKYHTIYDCTENDVDGTSTEICVVVVNNIAQASQPSRKTCTTRPSTSPTAPTPISTPNENVAKVPRESLCEATGCRVTSRTVVAKVHSSFFSNEVYLKPRSRTSRKGGSKSLAAVYLRTFETQSGPYLL